MTKIRGSGRRCGTEYRKTRERLVSRVLDATETRRRRHELDARFCSPWCSEFHSQDWGNRGISGDIGLCLVAKRPKLSNLPPRGNQRIQQLCGADDNPRERSGAEGNKWRDLYLTQKFGSPEGESRTCIIAVKAGGKIVNVRNHRNRNALGWCSKSN